MLTNHPGCFWPLLDVNFTENAQAMYLSIHDMSLKITNSTLQLLLPGINELTDWLVYSSCDKDNSVTYSSGSCFSIGKLILSCSAILCIAIRMYVYTKKSSLSNTGRQMVLFGNIYLLCNPVLYIDGYTNTTTVYHRGFSDVYPQTSNISGILVGNKVVDHSDVVGA